MRSSLVRALLVLGLFLGAVVMPAAEAAASSCAASAPAEAAARNTVVLVGHVEDVDDPGGDQSPHDVVWRLSVREVHMGWAATTTYVVAQDGCGPAAEPGREALFAATASGDRLVVDPCRGVDDPGTATAEAMLAAAGQASAPASAGSGLPGRARPELPRAGWSVGGALLVGAAGAAALWAARRAGAGMPRRRARAGE